MTFQVTHVSDYLDELEDCNSAAGTVNNAQKALRRLEQNMILC